MSAALMAALATVLSGCIVPNSDGSRRRTSGDGGPLVLLPGTQTGGSGLGTGTTADGFNIYDQDDDDDTDGTGEPTDPGEPALTFAIEAVGYSGDGAEEFVEVRAKDVLKVRFEPGINSERVEDTGFVPSYSRLFVHISVGDDYDGEKPTSLVSNGLLSPSQASNLIDFSSRIDEVGGSADADGYRTVRINVRKANNDYWCFNFGMYCTHTHVHHTHPWNGTLIVQTDDTEEI